MHFTSINTDSVHLFRFIYVQCKRHTCNLLMYLDRWWQRSWLFNKICA